MSVLQTQFQTSNVRHPRQAQFAGVSDAVELGLCGSKSLQAKVSLYCRMPESMSSA